MSYQLIYSSVGPYVITMEKHPDTPCDELRVGIVDPKYAPYCCHKAKVLEIEHKITKVSILNIVDRGREYIVGEEISKIIIYYKTYQRAFYWQLYKFTSNYSGDHKGWYDKGQKWSQRTFKNGKLDGPYKVWYDNGQMWSQRIYKDGKLDGSYMSWHKNGQKLEDSIFKDGKYDGSYLSWHENGQQYEDCIFKNGKKDGIYRSWLPNGQKVRELIFKDGIEEHT